MPTETTAEHSLKTWPEFFQAVQEGRKTFELRLDDRGFRLGDVLVLQEWSAGTGYTGREIRKRVSYILRGGGFGLSPDHVCMGLYSA